MKYAKTSQTSAPRRSHPDSTNDQTTRLLTGEEERRIRDDTKPKMENTAAIKCARNSIIPRTCMEKGSMDRQRQRCPEHLIQQVNVTTSGWRKAHAFTWKIPKWANN